jgi:hypothetical protein
MKSFYRRIGLLVVGCTATIGIAALIVHHSRQRVVLVTFQGPWAFAADPDNETSIYAFAPKTRAHRDLLVQHEEDGTGQPLAAGVYEVLLHSHRVRATIVDPHILQARIDRQGVQHALLDRSERYAIRLPRPEAYVSTSNGQMRAGVTYPPSPATEGSYAMSASLRYSASTLNGFTVTGSPDEGAFHPLAVTTRNLRFVIAPLPGERMDECEMHNREAFRDLAKLVQLKMFVDFGKYATNCHATDPQNPALN